MQKKIAIKAINNFMFSALALAVAVTVPFPLFAAQKGVGGADNSLLEGAKLCTRHLQRYEREYGIPAHLLSAIASTESGRYHSGLKMKLPWPWTINAEGKGYFFDTKEEAVAAAQKLRARGVQSFDVGCMQVNMYHHANAFYSLNQAFEPENNVAYAASFLRSLYQEGGNWKQAAANYHSKTPSLGNQYVGVVYNSWRGIVDKLRSARLSVPDSSVNGLQQMQASNQQMPSNVAKAYAPPAPKKIVMSGSGVVQSSSTLPQMKTISVKTQTSDGRVVKNKSSGMIIVRPEIKVVDSGALNLPEQNKPPEPLVMASANPFASGLPSTGGEAKQASSSEAAVRSQPLATPSAKVIRLDNKLVERAPANAGTAEDASKKSGPNFIFND